MIVSACARANYVQADGIMISNLFLRVPGLSRGVAAKIRSDRSNKSLTNRDMCNLRVLRTGISCIAVGRYPFFLELLRLNPPIAVLVAG